MIRETVGMVRAYADISILDLVLASQLCEMCGDAMETICDGDAGTISLRYYIEDYQRSTES